MPGDLPALYEHQCDPVANALAGTKPRARDVFFATWARHFTDPKINARVILLDARDGGEIVGSLACFQVQGVDGKSQDSVGYWIARPYWGQGIASRALAMFLREEARRPLHATACRANAASLRILEKCAFRCTGVRRGEETDRFVPREIAEFVLE